MNFRLFLESTFAEEFDAFVNEIKNDSQVLLVFSDWLEERGHNDIANAIRKHWDADIYSVVPWMFGELGEVCKKYCE